ncbi:hypothetical protein M8C21_021596 [Ambrosia artemisiifolia]|uniref:Uncharacterized protein n=1 Tax=Ambrosia artemisiifolia TaxID=4212 RepID=A0AAD5CPI2_AMBAR|nr:hypothetical protein M8C21_021596 [Ambrosia artemisiifolia]
MDGDWDVGHGLWREIREDRGRRRWVSDHQRLYPPHPHQGKSLFYVRRFILFVMLLSAEQMVIVTGWWYLEEMLDDSHLILSLHLRVFSS